MVPKSHVVNKLQKLQLLPFPACLYFCFENFYEIANCCSTCFSSWECSLQELYAQYEDVRYLTISCYFSRLCF